MPKVLRRQTRFAWRLIALTTVVAVAGPAWAQTCPKLKGRSDWPAALELGRITLEEAKAAAPDKLSAYTDKLTAISSACTAEADRNGKSPKVQMCIADSARLLRQFAVADCAYSAVLSLPVDQTAKGDAWEGKARNRDTWGLRDAQLIDAWKQSVKEKETPSRRWALAQALKTQGRLQEADDSYKILAGLPAAPGFTDAHRATALREQAHLEQDLGKPLSEIRQVWDAANRYNPTAEGFYQVGLSYFKTEPGKARDAFSQAQDHKGDTTSSRFAADALYMLSVLNARDAKTPDQWAQVKQQAQNSGLTDPGHKRVACLAHIASGDASLTTGTEAFLCAPGPSPTPTAEDKLLRGLYLLRRMQFLDKARCAAAKPGPQQDECWRQRASDVVRLANEARDEFSQGRIMVPQPGGPSASPAVLDWLLKEDQTAPQLASLLGSGENLANSVTQLGRGCANLAKPAPGGNDYRFFDQLDLLSCEAKPRA